MTKASLKVFFATFAIGMAVVGAREIFFKREPKASAEGALPIGGAPKSSAGANIAETFSDSPLRLPNSAEAAYEGKDGWEYSGLIKANFVSARAQLDSWMQNQGWIPENKITLDENIEPKVLLTFSREAEEMTVFIWKISTTSTGFAYRRESANEKEKR